MTEETIGNVIHLYKIADNIVGNKTLNVSGTTYTITPNRVVVH